MRHAGFRRRTIVCLFLVVAFAATNNFFAADPPKPGLDLGPGPRIDKAQIPKWSADDLQFFLHGSMSTEVVPEPVMRAFTRTYHDLFKRPDLSNLGLIPDREVGLPIGISRREVKHLGGLPSLGVNCAACHVAQIHSSESNERLRVLGATSHFDAETYFGNVIVATFQTAAPDNMKKFLAAYLDEINRPKDSKWKTNFDHQWETESKQITDLLAADPTASQGVQPGAMHDITPDSLKLDLQKLGSTDSKLLTNLSQAILKLFHNMRTALHVPEKPPEKLPPPAGPGRNDAFGLLSAALFNAPQPFAPVKFGLVWNVAHRSWVHWDGNTRSPLGRNILASLGLGAPLHGKHGDLDFKLIKRHTDLTEMIQPPHYPYKIDQAAAQRGATHFTANCVSCHGGPENDNRLHSVTEVGTDPLRAEVFTQAQADRFNKFLAELEMPGYKPSKEDGLRGTGKYWAANLQGVWARSPYLHNGSIRTMQELLTVPDQRAKTFQRGSQYFDTNQLGYTDNGVYIFDTSVPGNSNLGHSYGTSLTDEQKHDLIEYLKTL